MRGVPAGGYLVVPCCRCQMTTTGSPCPYLECQAIYLQTLSIYVSNTIAYRQGSDCRFCLFKSTSSIEECPLLDIRYYCQQRISTPRQLSNTS